MSDWIGRRKETWYEHLLPQPVTDAINTSPTIGALARYLNAQPSNLTAGIQDQYGSIADRDWLLQKAQGPSLFERMHPSAQDGVNMLGLLANFIGPGAKMPDMQLREMIGYRGLRASPSSAVMEKPIHMRTLEEDGLGIWHGTTPDVANSYALTSMINNTPERQAMEAARRRRFAKDFGTKRWDHDLEYLIASEMDQKAGRSYLANDGSNISRNRLLFRNPLILDFDGQNFNYWSGRDFNTNVAARIAQQRGHDALIARNVVDYGDVGYLPPWRSGQPATSVAVFDRSQVAPIWEAPKGAPFDPATADAWEVGKFLEAIRK